MACRCPVAQDTSVAETQPSEADSAGKETAQPKEENFGQKSNTIGDHDGRIAR
jgi:hypothetical protein